MLKKYLKISKLIFFVVALLGFLPLTGYTAEGKITLKILDIDSPFKSKNDEDYRFIGDFYNALSRVHPPVLVEYDNQYSLLLFVRYRGHGSDKRDLIYNVNLANHKINEVGRIGLGVDDSKLLSVFGHGSPGDPLVLILTRDELFGMTKYTTTRISVMKEDGGLYIQSTLPDRDVLYGLDNCSDSECDYKDAASIKKYFDDMYKK
ncbi:hypothetical protein RCS94_07030 [Orbaceae bacterium ac157xtp]